MPPLPGCMTTWSDPPSKFKPIGPATAEAIAVMRVRGAPLIGATAAYGMALAMRSDAGDGNIERAASGERIGTRIDSQPVAPKA